MFHAIGLPNAVAGLPVPAFQTHGPPPPPSPSSFADPLMDPDRPLARAIQRLSLIGVHHAPHVVACARARRDAASWGGDDDASPPSSAVAVSVDAVHTSTVMPMDDVRIEPLSASRFTADIGLTPLQNALGRCANPFASLAQDVMQIYAIAADRSLSTNTKAFLDLFGQLLDTVSGVEPRLALTRSLCQASERAIQVIHGAAPEAADITHMAETWRAVGAYKALQARAHSRFGPRPRAEATRSGINVNQYADLIWFERDMTSIVEPDLEEARNSEGSRRRTRNDLPRRYASAGGVPIQFVSADQTGNGASGWVPVPLTRYAVHIAEKPAEDGRLFEVSGHPYLTLNGNVYPVQRAWQPWEFIYSVSDPRLPPLPLMRHGSKRALRSHGMHPVDGVDAAPASDGFVRVNNKKYIVLNNATVEVARASVIGEGWSGERAVAIDDPLGAPDAYGIIHSDRLGPLVEGRTGYYRVGIDAPLGSGVHLMNDDRSRQPARMHYDIALQRWSVEVAAPAASPCRREAGAVPGIYQDSLDDLPFLKQRPALKYAISESLLDLKAHYLFRGFDIPDPMNAPADVAKADKAGEIDQAMSDRWAALVGWEQLSVRQKQQLAARITADVYRDHQMGRKEADDAAFCSRRLDLMSAEMQRYLHGQRHLMQISFIADRQGGPTHSVLLYADDPGLFRHFGQVNAARGDVSRVDPMTRAGFTQLLFDHRERVAIIDPAGPQAVGDFARERALTGVERVLEDMLRAADFDVGPNVAYRISARIPTPETVVPDQGPHFAGATFAEDTALGQRDGLDVRIVPAIR